MKPISILIIALTSLPLFSQEVSLELLDKIYNKGKSYTSPLKNGEIESLRKVKPPEDMWVFSKLEEYKKNLGSNNLIYGSIIMPSAISNSYSYNFFAYDIKKESYCLVAVVSYKPNGKDITLNNTYLFTEKKALQNWWNNIFSFYRSDEIKSIPKKYLFETCPPPPYRD